MAWEWKFIWQTHTWGTQVEKQFSFSPHNGKCFVVFLGEIKRMWYQIYLLWTVQIYRSAKLLQEEYNRWIGIVIVLKQQEKLVRYVSADELLWNMKEALTFTEYSNSSGYQAVRVLELLVVGVGHKIWTFFTQNAQYTYSKVVVFFLPDDTRCIFQIL